MVTCLHLSNDIWWASARARPTLGGAKLSKDPSFPAPYACALPLHSCNGLATIEALYQTWLPPWPLPSHLRWNLRRKCTKDTEEMLLNKLGRAEPELCSLPTSGSDEEKKGKCTLPTVIPTEGQCQLGQREGNNQAAEQSCSVQRRLNYHASPRAIHTIFHGIRCINPGEPQPDCVLFGENLSIRGISRLQSGMLHYPTSARS